MAVTIHDRIVYCTDCTSPNINIISFTVLHLGHYDYYSKTDSLKHRCKTKSNNETRVQ